MTLTDEELSKAVAEKVMGWTVWKGKGVTWDEDNLNIKPIWDAQGQSMLFTREEYFSILKPEHSALIVDKMVEKGWCYSIFYNGTRTQALFELEPDRKVRGDHWSDDGNRHRAIAQAALAAVEES